MFSASFEQVVAALSLQRSQPFKQVLTLSRLTLANSLEWMQVSMQ